MTTKEVTIAEIRMEIAKILDIPSTRVFLSYWEFVRFPELRNRATLKTLYDAVAREKSTERVKAICDALRGSNDRRILYASRFLRDIFQRLQDGQGRYNKATSRRS